MKKKPPKEVTIDLRILKRIVHGCLKSTADAHGDITKDLFGSVLKRFEAQVEGYVEQKDGE